jgi:hypothetical protein
MPDCSCSVPARQAPPAVAISLQNRRILPTRSAGVTGHVGQNKARIRCFRNVHGIALGGFGIVAERGKSDSGGAVLVGLAFVAGGLWATYKTLGRLGWIARG